MDQLAEGLANDYRLLPLNEIDRAMLDFAVKLTATPNNMTEHDISSLRSASFDDHDIHEIVEVVACFNYFNRLTNGLGVSLEPEW